MGCVPSSHLDRLRRENDALRDQLKDAQRHADLERAYECKICFERPIEVVLLPCGHSLACQRCARTLDVCCVCLAAVDTRTYLMMQ